MRTKAFRALVPAARRAQDVASVPYDVVSTEEARALADGNPHSFLHVLRAEIDFPPGADPYSDIIYSRARENFLQLQNDRILVREDQPCVYLYRQVMGQHSQTGVALVCHIDDYGEDVIRKHEKTRPAKETDRTRIVDTLNANPGPVFLTYRDDAGIDALVQNHLSSEDPVVDFTSATAGPGASGGAPVRHTVWRVPGGQEFVEAFARVPLAYVADGHHRSASAHRVGTQRRAANPDHNGSEPYNWFLSVLFPASQLRILPYNRVIRDLNGLDPAAFLGRAREVFEVTGDGGREPSAPNQACMFLDGSWHTLRWPIVESPNPIDRLDISVLQDRLFGPILGITDPRTDDRIDFVGGIRGANELEKRVNQEGWAVAFSLFPVTVKQLIDIADAGQIMPPKSTWFEPKLRSGLFVYTLD